MNPDKVRNNCMFCGRFVYGVMENVCPACEDNNMAFCVGCGKKFMIGVDGNELGLCEKCGDVFDLDRYYLDHEAGLVAFKGFDTLSRGLLEPYRRFKTWMP